MAQRSPYNDRYKTDQKGKTRRSASSAKPKRAIADLTPADSPKAPAKKKRGLFGGGQTAARRPAPVIESTPRMKQLRLVWWILWVIALGVALVILYLQRGGAPYAAYIPYGWAVWLVSMGGAFYLEFVPIRKERAVAIAAASAKGSGKGSTSSKAPTIPEARSAEAPAPDDRQPPSSDDPA
jgi:hypothetical protein